MRAHARKRCEVCGVAFGPLSSRKRFCSRKCYNTWQHEHGEGGRIDRKLAQITSRAQFLARRDLEAKAAGGVAVRVSQSRTGLRIESRGNCAGGCATNIPHT